MEMEVEGEDSYEKYSMESSSSSYDVSSSPQRPSSLSELVSSCHSSDSSRSSPVSETSMFSTSLSRQLSYTSLCWPTESEFRKHLGVV